MAMKRRLDTSKDRNGTGTAETITAVIAIITESINHLEMHYDDDISHLIAFFLFLLFRKVYISSKANFLRATQPIEFITAQKWDKDHVY